MVRVYVLGLWVRQWLNWLLINHYYYLALKNCIYTATDPLQVQIHYLLQRF